MIKTVVKRDGTIEKFDPEKLNRWAEWASDTCGVSWSDVILEASKQFASEMSTADLHKILISVCVNRKDTAHSRMAARLLVGHIYKEAFEDFSIPSLSDFYHQMVEDGYWGDIGYTEEELAFVDAHIRHELDFTYEYCTIRQFYDKYAISAYSRCLESPQMALIGVAMSNTRFEENRTQAAIDLYNVLSALENNLPTPSLSGQRTPQSGSPSCCVITGGDSVPSIGAAVEVAYTMTALSSGIGCELDTRSVKDPVKGGTIEHMGKLPYYKYLDRAVKANKQHARGGSATVTYSVFDPEIQTLLRLKSQRVHPDYRIDSMDYSLAMNALFIKKVALNQPWMLVSNFFAPKLYELQYSASIEELELEYDRVFASDVKKEIVPARHVAKLFFVQRGDTGRIYKSNLTNFNKHTPFKDAVRLTNLCSEIMLPTAEFPSIEHLYNYQGIGEVALCFLASIVVGRISEVAPGYLDPEHYCEVAYQTAKFVDNTIDQATYPYPAIEYTAKARRSIGIGVTDVAHYMARNGLKYDTVEGRNALHRMAELHSYALHLASVRLAKERGPCKWFHKTKYSDEKPWLPIDTYARAVDEHHTQPLLCDWEGLREEIKKYGMRFSVLEAFMPVESSSLFTASTNSLYPIRKKKIYKKSPKGVVYFECPGLEEFGDNYQNAYDIDILDMVKVYGIFQKFCGQGISADFYQDLSNGKKASMRKMFQALFLSAKLGLKTWYYLNTLTNDDQPAPEEESPEAPTGWGDVDEFEEEEEEGCESCSL